MPVRPADVDDLRVRALVERLAEPLEELRQVVADLRGIERPCLGNRVPHRRLPGIEDAMAFVQEPPGGGRGAQGSMHRA
jgi:hypothetical protein